MSLGGKAQSKNAYACRNSICIFCGSDVNDAYRGVVERCSRNQDLIELWKRSPRNSTWEIIGTIITVLEPLTQAVYRSQGRVWLLNDGATCFASLKLTYKDMKSASAVIRWSGFTGEIF